MTLLVAPRRRASMSWLEVRPSRLEAGMQGGQDHDRLIKYATVGVGACGAYVPLIGAFSAVALPVEPGHIAQVLSLYAIVGPSSWWLLMSAARNRRPRGHRWVFAGTAAAIAGGLPVVHADWIRGLYILTALVLVLVRQPWSLLLTVVLVAAPAPLAIAWGHTNWAAYFTLGLLLHGPPVAVLVWLAASARELRDARETLAREAVLRERLRIDEELRQTLGAALDTITVRAGLADRLASIDPVAAEQEVTAVTDSARQTLSEARRMVTRYQAVPLRAELDMVAALLSAAGIRTRMEVPDDLGSEEAPDVVRSLLRSGTARLLQTAAVQHCVITVYRRKGQVALEMNTDGIPAARR
jgi:two-component system sensor histidine kinase DesK